MRYDVIERFSVRCHNEQAYSKHELQAMFEKMLLIRTVEEEIIARYGDPGSDQKMRCPIHLSIGQEAAAVGACFHLTTQDVIFSTHRCHAHYLAKGGDLTRMVLELYGKQGGCLDGRGGSMHLMDPAVGVEMSIPIVASGIPLAVGRALANKIDGNSSIVLAFFGDGAVEEGVFHESMNFASLMHLPIIFVCENNFFSIYTHLSKRQPSRPLADLGLAHHIPTMTIDGNDPVAVAMTFKNIIHQVKTNCGPHFVILNTYRTREHCGVNIDDRLGYRHFEELSYWQNRDPIKVMLELLLSDQIISESEVNNLKQAISERVLAVFDLAEKASLPSSEMASKHVYLEK